MRALKYYLKNLETRCSYQANQIAKVSIIGSSSTGATHRTTRSQLRTDKTAVSDPQCQRMETQVYQGQQATSLAPGSLTQTSQKDTTAATLGSDDTTSSKNISRSISDTAQDYVTRTGRTVTPTQKLDLYG